MSDRSHLGAIEVRLSHERARLAAAPSDLRRVWVAQIERELAAERARLGLDEPEALDEMTDDELLAALAEGAG